MATINRSGTVHFHDASFSIWEEGIPSSKGFAAMQAFEREFKRDVFLRIVQQLNRLGWSCTVPQDYVGQYGAKFARNYRACSKGDLKGWLELSGRHIKFQMWQGINTPTRPDHGGRYEHNKEGVAPYLLRLEMIRTRKRICGYLCGVFEGYQFIPGRSNNPASDPLAYFNETWDGEYERKRGEHRFSRGADGWPDDSVLKSWSRIDKDGVMLSHGAVRCLRDDKGRILRGRVYGGINGMWMMVYGPGERDNTHHPANRYFTLQPGMPRKLPPLDLRRRRLEAELSKAVKEMDFERAAILKRVAFPTSEKLFLVFHTTHGMYHCPGFRSYTKDPVFAGRFTRAECRGYDRAPNRLVPAEEVEALPA